MRAYIVGSLRTIEVIAEEFTIPGADHRFIAHPAIDVMRKDGEDRKAFVATHLETSQIIGEGDTIDEAIAEGTRRWLAASPEIIEAKLIERRAWVAERLKSRAGSPP